MASIEPTVDDAAEQRRLETREILAAYGFYGPFTRRPTETSEEVATMAKATAKLAMVTCTVHRCVFPDGAQEAHRTGSLGEVNGGTCAFDYLRWLRTPPQSRGPLPGRLPAAHRHGNWSDQTETWSG